jgi:hypothetical protein
MCSCLQLRFSTIFVDTKLSVLPLSMITLHTLSLVLQAVLNKLFLWIGSLTSFSGFMRTFLIMSDLPSSAASTFIYVSTFLLLRFINVSFSTSSYSFSQDIPKTCAMFFHRHKTSLLLCLFLFLWEKDFFLHSFLLYNFLLFLSDYDISSLFSGILELFSDNSSTCCLDFFLCFVDSAFLPTFLYFQGYLISIFHISHCHHANIILDFISQPLMYLETFSSSFSLCLLLCSACRTLWCIPSLNKPFCLRFCNS